MRRFSLPAMTARSGPKQCSQNAKPSPQRHFGRRENRAGDQGCLPSTGGTLVKRAGLDEAVMLAAADWADETRGPAPTHHRLAALILGSIQTGKLSLTEALLKLDRVARHRSNSQKQPYVPGTIISWLRIIGNQEYVWLGFWGS